MGPQDYTRQQCTDTAEARTGQMIRRTGTITKLIPSDSPQTLPAHFQESYNFTNLLH